MSDILITADALAALLAEGDPVRVLDVRWRLDRPDGRPEYLAGHIPGAVFVSLDHDLAAHGEPTDGRHPLPEVAALQAAARRWGIDDGDTVVVYDDLSSLSALGPGGCSPTPVSRTCGSSTAHCGPGPPPGCPSRGAMSCRHPDP